MPELPSLWWAVALIPLGLAGMRYRAALPLLFFVAGLCWAAFRAGLLLEHSLPADMAGQDLKIEGYIADIPRPAEHGQRFAFDVICATRNGEEITVPRRIQLSTYYTPLDAQVGDKWSLTARLKRPHGYQNPGGFDYEAHLFQHGIRAVGYVRETPPPILMSSETADYRIGRFRQYLSAAIARLLPENVYAGMITAFANGDESAIADEQWTILARTGTIHLIAISGMNIGLVSGLIFLLVRWLWRLPGVTVLWLPAPKAAAIAGLLSGACYSALAGFAIPTQRAVVMLAVVMGGIVWSRQLPRSYILAAALLAVLAIDPLSVLAAGFWLSFAAVALILYVIHPGRSAGGWRARWREWTGLQWAIAVGLLPLMLVLFGKASLSAPLANLVAIPVIESLVIPLTLLGVLALIAVSDSLAGGLFQAAAWCMDMLWRALEPIAALEHTQWAQHAPPLWTLVCAGIGIAVLLAPRGVPARWVGALWIAPMLWVRPPTPAPGELWFTLLDVGQGLAVVAQTAGHTLLYDSGGRYSARFDAGRIAVVPFLRHAGVQRIDRMIVSHGHRDHIGGVASVREALPVERILTSVPEQLADAERCHAGQAWEWDGVRFEIIHPPLEEKWRGNNASCVLRIATPHGAMLLPGDIAAAAERDLAARAPHALKADVLVAPHHGSKTSSTPVFIDAVAPRHVLLPVGYRNRFQHPHRAVVERYRWLGIEMYSSARHGAVSLRMRQQGLTIETYRQTRRRYWLNPVDTEE